MGSIIIPLIFSIVAVTLFLMFRKHPILDVQRVAKAIAAVLLVGSLGIFLTGAFGINEAGYCTFTRTVFGEEKAKCDTGWYFAGWGQSTKWPQEIVIINAAVQVNQDGSIITPDGIGEGSDLALPQSIRMTDNWKGDVMQATRFTLPKDEEQFKEIHRKFRSPERLIRTVLRPTITSSLDTVANMFSMEEYYSGGARDQFKTEFVDTVSKGRAKVEQVTIKNESASSAGGAAPSDATAAQDTSDVGDTQTTRVVMRKMKDSSGNDIRAPHEYTDYGIVVSSVILETIDPDNAFEDQQKKRKEAVSRRIVARDERMEQEEQKLLAIQEGETAIAKRQAKAKEEQIQQTTDAETKKKLAIIDSERLREEARIQKETAQLDYEKSKIQAGTIRELAEAKAYEKKSILEADGALQAKLDAYVKTQQAWAEAAKSMNVPSTIVGGESGNGSAIGAADSFMQLMTMKAAKELMVDPAVK